MKKIFKITGITLGVLIGITIVGIAVLFVTAPEDIVLTPEQEQEENRKLAELFSDVEIRGFVAQTIDGVTVTADIFKDYDITMVNIWATFCGPCIEEMPEIARLYNDRPQGSNIISICVDAGDNSGKLNRAKKIMGKSGAEFITIIPDRVLKNKLTNNVQIFPTTIFMDNKGQVVGNPHFGGRDAESYRQSILDQQKLLIPK